MKNKYQYSVTLYGIYRVIFVCLLLIMVSLFVLIVRLSTTIQSTPFLISYRPSYTQLLLLVILLVMIYKLTYFALLKHPFIAISNQEFIYYDIVLLRKNVIKLDTIKSIKYIASKYDKKIQIHTKNGGIKNVFFYGPQKDSEVIYKNIKRYM